MNISDRDWNRFCEKLPEWKERYIRDIIDGYTDILNDDTKSSADKFWELQERVKHDETRPGVIMVTNQSESIWNIACLISENVITYDDLSGFSGKLQQEVHRIEESRGRRKYL